MKTEQADSLGTDVALRGPRIPRWRDAVPAVWLNLVCLDAPLVAVAWWWLFARTFQIPLQLGNAVALFLTAWLIYLADRFADAISLRTKSPRSLRQEFCLKHREAWITTVALVAGFDAYVIWRTTALETFLVGAVVGILALIYLVANHPLGLIWRSLPAKELAIGVLFATGTVVALLPRLPMTETFAIAAFFFAVLCSLNCISIASWERELDRAQQKISIATGHPGITRQAAKICGVFGFVALALAFVTASDVGIFVCIGVSGLLLAWLNASPGFKEGRFTNRPRRFVNRRSLDFAQDQRTALADLVLLTPILFLIVTAL